jgi:hypothetical protein
LEISALPNAVNIPLGQLASRLSELNSADDMVVFCKGGTRSARALELLASAGFKKVKNLKGGINAWAKEVDKSRCRCISVIARVTLFHSKQSPCLIKKDEIPPVAGFDGRVCYNPFIGTSHHEPTSSAFFSATPRKTSLLCGSCNKKRRLD